MAGNGTRLPGLFYMGYSPYEITRDSGGGLIMLILIFIVLSDNVLIKRYKRELIFVCLMFALRIFTMIRQVTQVNIPQDVSLDVPLLCPSIFNIHQFLYLFGHALAIFLSIAHCQAARGGKMFSVGKWLIPTAVLTVGLLSVHIWTGTPYHAYNCCCTPINWTVNKWSAYVDIAIHFITAFVNLYTVIRSNGPFVVVPLALLVFSATTFPYTIMSIFTKSNDQMMRDLREYSEHALNTRGDLFCLVLVVGLLVNDSRFNSIVRARFRTMTKRELMIEEELISASEITTD